MFLAGLEHHVTNEQTVAGLLGLCAFLDGLADMIFNALHCQCGPGRVGLVVGSGKILVVMVGSVEGLVDAHSRCSLFWFVAWNSSSDLPSSATRRVWEKQRTEAETAMRAAEGAANVVAMPSTWGLVEAAREAEMAALSAARRMEFLQRRISFVRPLGTSANCKMRMFALLAMSTYILNERESNNKNQ